MITRAGDRSTPPLENGDRLTWLEFERRAQALERSGRPRKVELIDGIVYVASAARVAHGDTHGFLTLWLGHYALATPGARLSPEVTLRLDDENAPQPDATLRLLPGVGGRSRVDDDGYLCGPVELVCEVALSSASYDLHQKKEVYRRHGFEEYLAVVVHSDEVRWFVLGDGAFVDMTPDADGVLRSGVFPGLWLDPKALLAGDGPALMATLQRGLASPEHAAFVQRLSAGSS
jgi:Uma2 family endonuclease